MRAAVYYGPNDLRVEERPRPRIESGEVLLKVAGAGICGTDLRIFHGAHRMYAEGTVRVPGHEVVGEIVQAHGVESVTPGDRVIVAPNWGCGHCRQCITGQNNRCAHYGAVGITHDGAFAEYMRVPAPAVAQGNLIPVAPGVDAAAASLVEPLACVLRGQTALGGIKPTDVVLVMGAGPIGVMHIMLARLQGARRVIACEPNPARLGGAVTAGADRVVNPQTEDLAMIVAEESGDEGADVIVVAAPAHSAQQDALRLAAIGGRISFFGGLPKDRPHIQFDSNLVHYRELLVTGTTACSTGDCRQAAAIVGSGRMNLAPLISRRFPLERALEAFAAAEDRDALKIVIEPGPS